MRNHPASASHFHFGNVLANIAVVPATSPDGWDEMGSVTGRVFVAVDFNAEAQSRREIECQPVADSTLVADKAATSWQNYTFSIFHPPFACAPANRHPYTVSYAYDHRGRMVSKRITENDGHDTLVKSTTYLWDGWNIIREIQWPVVSRNTSHYPLVTDYVWGLDIDGTLQGAGVGGGLLAVVRDGETYFPTYDANGNVSEYVTTNGTIVAHYDYSPFGETLIESGVLASTFTHRFNTKPWCPVTGLYEYQMRKYRTEIGRWLNRDPSGERGGMNLYAICANNANGLVDPLGLITYYNCTAVQKKALRKAFDSAQNGIDSAISYIVSLNISKMLSRGMAPEKVNVILSRNRLDSMTRDEHEKLDGFVIQVLANLQRLKTMFDVGSFGVECKCATAFRCREKKGVDSTDAYVNTNKLAQAIRGNNIYLCPRFFNLSGSEQVNRLVHEATHWHPDIRTIDAYASAYDLELNMKDAPFYAGLVEKEGRNFDTTILEWIKHFRSKERR